MKQKRMRRRLLLFSGARTLFYIGVYTVFALIPLDVIRPYSFCLIYHLTGVRCFGCGMSRAFCALLHLNFAEAWAFNPLIFALFPLISVLVGNEVWAFVRRAVDIGYEKQSLIERLLAKMIPALFA